VIWFVSGYPTPTEKSGKKEDPSNLGAAVGGVVGAVAVIGIVAVIFIIYLR